MFSPKGENGTKTAQNAKIRALGPEKVPNYSGRCSAFVLTRDRSLSEPCPFLSSISERFLMDMSFRPAASPSLTHPGAIVQTFSEAAESYIENGGQAQYLPRILDRIGSKVMREIFRST